MIRVAALAAALAMLAGIPAAALASACARTSVTDLEDEVMCPVCGTTLGLAREAPQARRERAFIERLVARCRTKSEIKSALAREFGSQVLAEPAHSGFGLTAYLVPALAVGCSAGALAVAVGRWRRRRATDLPPAGDVPRLDPSAEARVEAELARLDRRGS
jgi:cytochrome c-type biogenesis protein CcmH/NrfF